MQNQKRIDMLVKDGLKQYICEDCKIGNIWNNAPLVLQLHHIDGNHKNNDIKNIKILCPNCHSQTTNFRSKKNIDDSIWIQLLSESKTIGEAISKSKKYPSGALYKRLEALIVKFNLSHIAKYDYISNKRNSKNKTKNCKYCNKEFQSKNIYCSEDCRIKATTTLKYTNEFCEQLIEYVKEYGWMKASQHYNTKSEVILREAIKRYIKRNNLNIDFYSISKFKNHSSKK